MRRGLIMAVPRGRSKSCAAVGTTNIECRVHDGISWPTHCCYGYLIDMFSIIINRLQLKVDLYAIKDGYFGSYKNGSWNGMIADVVNGQVRVFYTINYT